MGWAGVFEEYRESIQARGGEDPALALDFYAKRNSKFEKIPYKPLWDRYCTSESAVKRKDSNEEYATQIRMLQSMTDWEKAYISYHYLLDICIYREKQLFALKHQHNFETFLIKDTIDEYISVVQETWQNAATEIEVARKHLKLIPQYSFTVDDEAEKSVPITTLLDSLFHYLTTTADFDDSHFLQAVFVDLSKLIVLVQENTYGKQPKVICREYYESTFQPTFGIARCDNCGEPLFSQCPYCFNCFERS